MAAQICTPGVRPDSPRRRHGRDTRRLSALELNAFEPQRTVPVDREVLAQMTHLAERVAAASTGQMPLGSRELAEEILIALRGRS